MTVAPRRARGGDAPDVARLLHDFNTEFGDPTPGVEPLTAIVRDRIESGAATVLLAGDGPDGIAVIRLRPSLWVAGLDAHLEELYVVAQLRGRGIGRALLEAAMEAAREAGAVRMDLGTAETDTAARALYESAGFTNRERPPDGPAMLFYERDLE